MSWTKVLSVDELSDGKRQVVKIGDRKILMINNSGKIYAVSNSCPHLKLPMKKGKITEDCAIVCPFHRSVFSLETGEVKQWSTFPPLVGTFLGKVSSPKPLPVFPIRVNEGHIEIDIDS